MVPTSLACALVASLCYGAGSVLQAAAARRTETSAHLDPMLLVRLTRQVSYAVGLALDLVGFVAAAIALRFLPLFLVQSAVAASVGVTAIGAAILFESPLRQTERIALVGLTAGLLLLAASARPERAATIARSTGWWLLAAAAGVVVLGAISVRFEDRPAAAILALCAGASWAATGIAARVLRVPSPWWHLAADPFALAVVAYGVLGALLFATALQRGSVTAVSAIVFTVETVVPSAIGLAFLGDHTRTHFAPVAATALVMTVAASITLARSSEPPSHPADSRPFTADL